MNTKGQAASELVFIIPLFVILAGGILTVGYMCWQGIKVQEAANLAARIQGQERVSGAYSPANTVAPGIGYIAQDNGTDVPGDTVPDDAFVKNATRDTAFSGFKTATRAGGRSVYGRIYQAVQGLFNPGERKKLFIPLPQEGTNTDRVLVVRVMVPPPILGYQPPSVRVEASAYGGEDPGQYGVRRWGRTTGAQGSAFYKGAIKNPGND